MSGFYPCHGYSAKAEVIKVFPNAKCFKRSKWHFEVMIDKTFLSWGKAEAAWIAWDIALCHLELIKHNSWTKKQLLEFLPNERENRYIG